MKQYKLFAPLALLIILAVALSGCGAGQQVTAADVISKMRETMKTTQTVQGMDDMSVTINKDGIKTLMQGFMGKGATDQAQGKGDWITKLPDSASATIKSWQQSPDKARIEITSSSIPGAKGMTLVYDGLKVYAYDPSHNTVYSGTPEKLMDKVPADIKALIQGVDMQKQLDTFIDAADVKLLGTEKIAGLDAYKLEIAPKPDAATRLGLPQMIQMQAGVLIKDARATLWVDKDRWIPLKLTVQHPNIGTFTSAATKLDLNKPIDSSTFVLQVPAGAKTVDLDALAQQYGPQSTTLPAARTQAAAEGWKLLEPSYVPTGATLIEVLNMPSNTSNTGAVSTSGSTFTFNYSSPTSSFSIIESKHEYQKGLGDEYSGRANSPLKEVDVRGVKARAFSPDGTDWTAMYWQEQNNGIWVAIHGKFSLAEATKIAQGLK